MAQKALLLSGVLLLVWTGPPAAKADPPADFGRVLLLMKEGRPIPGVLLSGDAESLQVRLKDETITVAAADVKPTSYFIALSKTVKSDDPKGQLVLLRFAAANDLTAQVNLLKRRIVRLDDSLTDEVTKIVESAAAAGPDQQQGKDTDGAQNEAKDEEPPAPTGQTTIPTTQAQIDANHRTAEEWFAQARKNFAPSLHLVETPNFLIYSAWDKKFDDDLAKLCESMYKAMRQRFNMPGKKSVWAGKLPIYVFWEAEHFRRFCTEVDQVGQRSPHMLKAGGYHSSRGSLRYIVLNRAPTQTEFRALLVHEASHAFISRYISNRHVSSWANEGIAELMAAQLVDGSSARTRYIDATRTAIKNKVDIRPIFNGVPLDGFWYGIAQSLVRYMIHRDKEGFIQFIKLYKAGKSEADALKEAMGLTHDELAKAWLKSVR